MSVSGPGKDDPKAAGAAKPKAATGTFKVSPAAAGTFKAQPQAGAPAPKPPAPAAAAAKQPAPAAPPAAPKPAPPKTPAQSPVGAFQGSRQEPIRTTNVQPKIRKEVMEFAQGMVQAADAASAPGPTSDSDLLPRESVSGLFVRDFALQGALALGRPPLGQDEAARIVIEKHIAGQPGLYYDANVTAQGEDAFTVKLHRLNPNPPFLPDPKPEASYVINRRTWQVEEGKK